MLSTAVVRDLDSLAFGGVARVAPQPVLGLCAERRAGIDPRDPAHPAALGTPPALTAAGAYRRRPRMAVSASCTGRRTAVGYALA